MRLLCSRCRTSRHVEGPDGPPHPVVCPACLETLRRQWGALPLDEVPPEPPVAASLVDAAGRLAWVSAPLAAALGAPAAAVTGLLLGEALGCHHAGLAGGCGHTIHCPPCPVAGAVRAALQRGEEPSGVAATIQGCGGPRPMRLSACRTGDFALLVFEALAAARAGYAFDTRAHSALERSTQSSMASPSK